MNILINIALTVVISTLSLFGAYKFIPLGWIEETPKLGTSVTTIQGTDTLSSSRTTINNNFTALNNGKIENSTTSLPFLTTIGTIVGGTWNADIISGVYGGTASSTLSLNQVLLGNTTSGIKVVAGYGSSGQFLTSNGSGNAPTWTTSAIDLSLNYSWTGNNYFKNLNASSTVANPIVLNSISYSTPSTQGASSTVLTNNGSGALIWMATTYTLSNGYSGAGSGTAAATTTLLSVTIPANTLTTSNHLVGHLTFDGFTNGAGVPCDVRFGNGTASTTIFYTIMGSLAKVEFDAYATSTSYISIRGTYDSMNGITENSIKVSTAASRFNFSYNIPYAYTGNLYISVSGQGDTVGQCKLIGRTIKIEN